MWQNRDLGLDPGLNSPENLLGTAIASDSFLDSKQVLRCQRLNVSLFLKLKKAYYTCIV